MSVIVELNQENYDSIVRDSGIPVLVDFWAPWCQPCRLMLPILEEIAAEYAGRLVVAKVNVDVEPELAEGIGSIPTMRLFKGGQLVWQVAGARPRRVLLNELDESI